MALKDWSVSANSNSVVGSINWSEGQLPSTVNNSARQMMADVADWYSNPSPVWYQADSATYASGTTFTVAGNLTARYLEGRRVTSFNTGGQFYGSVVSSTFSTNTTVTVAWDSGSMDAGLTAVKLSLVTSNAMPTKNVIQHIDNAVSISSTVQAVLTLTSNFTSTGMWLRCSAGAKQVCVNNSSQFYVANSANTLAIMVLTDAGAATFTGDITANSDETIKHGWEELPDDFVEQLAGLRRVGTYEMKEPYQPGRHVGVGAQSLQEILPEAVMMDESSGKLSVAYGNAALAACVMLAREVMALKKRVEELEGEQ